MKEDFFLFTSKLNQKKHYENFILNDYFKHYREILNLLRNISILKMYIFLEKTKK